MIQHRQSRNLGTPCPVPVSVPVPASTTRTSSIAQGVLRRSNGWRDSNVHDNDNYGNNDGHGDTTANIEFTSAFGKPSSSLMGVKPRRTNGAVAGRRNKGAGNHGQSLGFTIYDDDDEAEEVSKGRMEGKSITAAAAIASATNTTLARPAKRGVNLMAQPPQRPKQRVSFMPCPSSPSGVEAGGQGVAMEGAAASKARLGRRVSLAPPRRPLVKEKDGGLGNEGQNQKQQQQYLAPLPEDSMNFDIDMTTNHTTATTTTILKPARRGTIYIPNEDTTMPSMYMGIFSPIKDLDTRAIVEASAVPDSDLTGIAAQMVRKRAPRPRRQSTTPAAAAASPKRGRERGPLQIVSRSVQATAVVEDRLGQGMGKENIPPGQTVSQSVTREQCDANKGTTKPARRTSTTTSVMQKGMQHRSLADSLACMSLSQEARPKSSRLFAPTTSSLGKKATDRPLHGGSSSTMSVKNSWNAGPRASASTTANDAVAVAVSKKPAAPKPTPPKENHERIVLEKKPTVPTRFVVPTIKNETTAGGGPQVYPVLTEDLATPAMYEDNWLAHQEIAMTQLVNNLFESSASSAADHNHNHHHDPATVAGGGLLRVRLLDLYGNAENALLFKRMQGALLYGAFRAPAPPSEGSAGGGAGVTAKLNSDVGKRKAFTDLWVTTYDLGCLRAALEAVVGRQCAGGGGATASPSRSPSSTLRKDGSGSSEEIQMNRARQSLRKFIEAFLIRNEDGSPDETASASTSTSTTASSSTTTSHASWSYQRTMIRSLMLIKLLDSAPTNGCLFQASSSHKSSISLVQALFQMLNPSAGDPVRALGHLGYSVSHMQYPLEEYSYKIENLAVDLRDGVRLTRLIELLLPESDSFLVDEVEEEQQLQLRPQQSQRQQQDWPRRPLSQQLKFPCLGRATKIYNVQVALNALHNVQGMAALTHDITADDIVDGFREKTVRLLWGLTNKWGLGGLVDWGDVEREIKRLRRANRGVHDGGREFPPNVSEGEDDDGYSRYRTLLVSWAQVIASTRGVSVTNMTTSFADGRVFESIVDEYQDYIVSDNRPTDRKRHLSERLRGLGCSDQFAGLFSCSSSLSSNRTHIFDRDFVMAALAFLCSRLLGPSRSWRAATTIQKAWRNRWGRVLEAQKCQLKMMAESCAAVVRASAGGVLQEGQDEELPVCDARNMAPSGKDGESEAEAEVETETVSNKDLTMETTVSVSADQNAEEPVGDIWLNL